MNKNKILIIILPVLFVVLLLGLSFLFSDKGTLKMKITPKDTKVTINKDVYQAGNSFSKRLSPGQHKITVSKNGYETFEETVVINKRESVKKTVQLKDLKGLLLERANSFVKDINSGTPSTEPKQYQEKLQKDTTSQLYNYLKERYYIPAPSDIPQANKQDFSEVKIIGTDINTISESDTKVVVRTEVKRKVGAKDFSYKITYTLSFIKQGNEWLINRMVAE